MTMTRPIAILCSGPSLAQHPLSKIPMETIGINSSWSLIKSSYHVMCDPLQWEHYTRTTNRNPSTITNLHTGQDGPGVIKLKLLDTKRPRFSLDPYNYGAWLCGTVTWVALQIAVAMKRSPIYLLGLDLHASPSGEHKIPNAPGKWTDKAQRRQLELFGYARGYLVDGLGIDIINVEHSPDTSACWAFETQTFARAFSHL